MPNSRSTMTIAAYTILIITFLLFAVAMANFALADRLHRKYNALNALVSVLIPARNEASNIGNLLTDLLAQPYKNIEIIVFNDQSTDQTAEIVAQFAQTDQRVRLIESAGLTEGWLGKNFGCHNLAHHANGQYLLFLDADVRVSGTIITDAVGYLNLYQLALLSIFPKQSMKSLGERLTVPNMNFILLSLLPLPLVQRLKFPSMAAANGQFMLFDAKVYQQTQPHLVMRQKRVEDIEIARWLKKQHLKVACHVAQYGIKCRMYNGFNDSVNGFSKNVASFFGHSFLLATLFWGITTFGFVGVYLFAGLKLSLICLALALLTRVFASATSRQNITQNLLLAVPQQFSLGWIITTAFYQQRTKKMTWKGRNI